VARDVQDETEPQAFVEVFTELGFTEVAAEKVPLPAHVVRAMKDEEDDDDELAEAIGLMTYLKITTGEGTFGVFIAAYPVLDLTGTGVTYEDLTGTKLKDAGSWPDMIGFGEERDILKFRDLLKARAAPQGG
jgi:hypothetical protein